MDFVSLLETKIEKFTPEVLGRRVAIKFKDTVESADRVAVGTIESYVIAEEWTTVYFRGNSILYIQHHLNPELDLTIFTDKLGR